MASNTTKMAFNVGRKIKELLPAEIRISRIKQPIVNFLGGVNDTMNYPSIAIGKIGAYLTPEGSKANENFKDFEQFSRKMSDMGQDRTSAGYKLGRVAPGLAVIAAAPAAGSVALPEFVGIESVGLNTLAAPLDYQAAVDYQMQQEQVNVQRKQKILESLIKWRDEGVDFNDEKIKPLIQDIINEYNSL